MKKLFLSCIQLLMSALLITGSASAQKNMAKASVVNSQTIDPNAAFSFNSNETSKAGADLKDIHARAIKNFNRKYKNAEAARWYNSEKTIVASFEENGILNTVVYLKNGRWLHTLLNYDETHLPTYIRSIITDNFRNYRITWVTEVHESDKIMYFVNIENEKRFKQILVCNEEFGVYKDFKKSN